MQHHRRSGFKLADATAAAAAANPSIKFAIVDFAYEKPIANVKPLVFNTAQSSFLAGYLAAGMSQTGKVGTFGGLNIPTVTIFMDGFAEALRTTTRRARTSRCSAGTRPPRRACSRPTSRTRRRASRTVKNLITQGADIVFPVAGPAGLGALQAAKASGDKVDAIWVDTDECESAAEYCGVLLTSVYKGMDVAVKDAIKSAVKYNFTNAAYVGTLESNGTGLSPYHEFDSKIPAELKERDRPAEAGHHRRRSRSPQGAAEVVANHPLRQACPVRFEPGRPRSREVPRSPLQAPAV